MYRAVLVFLFLLGVLYADDSKPNILFILADDLGIGDLGCYGNPYVDTPSINGLAGSGVRLTDHYAPSPLCAPSRAAFLTGRYNHRTGAVDVPSNRGLDRIELSEKTFGDYFKNAGYQTALIGKWHNGLYCRDHLPHRRGFDWFFGFPNGGQDYWKWNLMKNDEVVSHDGRYLTDVLNEETIRFVKEASRKGKPFAIFLAHHVPHSPFQAPEVLVVKYKKKLKRSGLSDSVATIYAMIEAMDRGLGEVFAALSELDIDKNTIVVFTSDNGAYLGGGAWRYHGPYKGNKGDVGEQGIRVPGIVSWPGKIPKGKVITTPIHGCDWLPTLYSLTGEPIPKAAKSFDGRNVLSVLKGETEPGFTDRDLFFQKNRYMPVGHSDGSIRQGPWKLVWPGIPETMRKQSTRDNPSYLRGIVHPHWEMPLDRGLDEFVDLKEEAPQLYHLARDPGERNDLAKVYPEKVKELSKRYDRWFSEVMVDWRKSRSSIMEHDISYWEGREPPDPKFLFNDFWLWNRIPGVDKTERGDPLKHFQGYWTNQ